MDTEMPEAHMRHDTIRTGMKWKALGRQSITRILHGKWRSWIYLQANDFNWKMRNSFECWIFHFYNANLSISNTLLQITSVPKIVGTMYFVLSGFHFHSIWLWQVSAWRNTTKIIALPIIQCMCSDMNHPGEFDMQYSNSHSHGYFESQWRRISNEHKLFYIKWKQKRNRFLFSLQFITI